MARGITRLPRDLLERGDATERPSVYIPLTPDVQEMSAAIVAVFNEHVSNFKKTSKGGTKSKMMEWRVRLDEKRRKESMSISSGGSKRRREVDEKGSTEQWSRDKKQKKGGGSSSRAAQPKVSMDREKAILAYRQMKAKASQNRVERGKWT
jgi:hypothetical protein